MKRTGSENAHTLPLSQRLLARPEEAAELLGVGRSTIYELMRAGELPVVHIGRAARIPVQELRHWVETHETPTFHAHGVPQVHERPLHLP